LFAPLSAKMLRFLLVIAAFVIAAQGTVPKPALYNAQNVVDFVNSLKTTWKAAHSKRFDGVSMETIKGMMGVKSIGLPPGIPVKDPRAKGKVTLPDKFDAREQWPDCPSTSEIRDQAACGSCWAFGAVEAMTDRICIQSKGASKPHISAQDLLSCCKTCGLGCNGGYPTMAWRYWVSLGLVPGSQTKDHSGSRPSEAPPFALPVNGTMKPCGDIVKTPACKAQCLDGYPTPYAEDKHFGKDSYGVHFSEEAIRQEIFTNGPVEAAYTVYEDFLSYHTGVYHHVTGKMLGGHGVKILGWGEENGSPYWLVANSWNTEWGDKGFFKILRGKNECGIERQITAGMAKL